MDKTVLRLVYVALTIIGIPAGFGWFMIIAYFLLWVIAPKALTVTQRLEMRGEDVTVENIKSGFEDAKNFVQSEEFKSNTKSIGTRLAEVIMAIMKIVGTFFGVIFGIVGFVIVAALVGVLISLIANPAWTADWIGVDLTCENVILIVVALLLVVGCPVFSIIYWIMRILSQRKAKSNTPLWISLILWFAGIFMLISVSVNNSVLESGNFNRSINFNLEKFAGKTDSPYLTDTLRLEPFENIRLSGAVSAVLVQDSVNQVIISAPEDMRKRLKIKVEDSKLSIYPEPKQRLLNINFSRIKIIIHSAGFNKIDIAGATQLATRDTIKANSLQLDIAGASRADIKAQVRNIEAEVAGASQLVLAGSAADAAFEAAGASKIRAGNFAVSSLKVEAAGASNASVRASEKAEASAYGASKITVAGNPAIRENSTGGAGKIDYE
jgi:phage shock protein PspC (stress-responsive transcriptional regulator)